MEALEMLLTRRSVAARAMREPGPNRSELESILSAGIRVPDHGKLFPWRIQVLDPQAQGELGDICAEIFAVDKPDASDEEISQERRRPGLAPLLLIVSSNTSANHHIPESEQVLSGGAVCQNLLNAAHSLGYVAQWLTEWPAYDRRVSSALGLQPENSTIGWIYLGSAKNPPEERRRAKLEDVVSYWPGESPYELQSSDASHDR